MFVAQIMISETKGIDAQLGSRYQFHLFENFEGCKEVYEKESNMTLLMFKAKNRLGKLQNQLTLIQKNIYEEITQLKSIITHQVYTYKKEKRCLNDLIVNFPQYMDYVGSIKGFFILHYAYGFNIEKAVLNGKLSYKNQNKEFKEYQVRLSKHYPSVCSNE